MKKFLNTFNVMGIVLIIIGIIGLATNNKFLSEAGEPLHPQAGLIYLGAGAIMLFNGFISMRFQDTEPNQQQQNDKK